jgi:hypothetical protein
MKNKFSLRVSTVHCTAFLHFFFIINVNHKNLNGFFVERALFSGWWVEVLEGKNMEFCNVVDELKAL